MIFECADPGLLSKEYFEIVRIVSDFDSRLLTIKGWGVTFSLATLVVALQKRHSGLFLAAIASSLSFWMLEGTIKGHQMRYYPRMAEIEAVCKDEHGGPRIHGSWSEAGSGWFRSSRSTDGFGIGWSYWLRWFLPHVMLPHAFTLAFAIWFLRRTRRAEDRPGSDGG